MKALLLIWFLIGDTKLATKFEKEFIQIEYSSMETCEKALHYIPNVIAHNATVAPHKRIRHDKYSQIQKEFYAICIPK